MQDQTLPTVTESAMRGFACKCPRCGRGRLYAGFLNLRADCEACGLDYAFIDSGDCPAGFIIIIFGGLVVGRAPFVVIKDQPPLFVPPARCLSPLLVVTHLTLRS